MVFSFFKKPAEKKLPEKMVAKPPVTPSSQKSRGAEEQDDRKPAGARTPETDLAQGQPSQFSNFVFSDSSPDFQIEGDIDPVDANGEEAAMFYANHQDDAARLVLENSVRVNTQGSGERLWLMLFDLYQILGKRNAFESLGVEYAQSFEKSPPGWRAVSDSPPSVTATAAGSVFFNGDLVGANESAFTAVQRTLSQKGRLRVDLSRVKRFDAEGCGRMLSLMRQARQARREIEFLGRDTLGAMLQAKIVPGEAKDRECWLLFLELCQLQGRHEVFDDVAVDYAVTFEVSPPSWEDRRVAAPEPPRAANDKPAADAAPIDAYVLEGNIRNSRFGDLAPYAEAHENVVIDCSRLIRIDFVSAGALLNVLTPIRREGKPVVSRHPNHLVAELFRVIGLSAMAQLVFAKS